MINDIKFEVFFSGEEVTSDLKPFQIIIWPSNYKWNDFQHKTHCKYKVINTNKEVLDGELLLGLLDFKSENKFGGSGLGNLMSERNLHPQDRLSTSELGSFFTMLTNMQEYRNLIKFWGIEQGCAFLKAINDMVMEQSKTNSSVGDWFKLAEQSKVFKLSFMRNSEPFFAYHNAESILRGLDLEDIDGISSSLDLEFKLDGFANKHEINFRFHTEGLLPSRINVLIGENGLGKSQALNHIVRAALQQREYKDNLIDPTTDDGRPMISRLLAIGTPGETRNTYPADNIKNPKLDYRRLILTRSSNKGVGKNILQLARTDESISVLDRWDIFIKAISRCIDVNTLYIAKKTDSRRANSGSGKKDDYLPIIDLKNGWSEQLQLEYWGEIDSSAEPRQRIGENYIPLSSGQLSFFKFALLACLNIENGSLVLIDEPETHLHPNLIADFVELLNKILSSTGSFAIVATHSSYFVRELSAEQVFVFKTQTISETSDYLINIGNPRLETYGANIGAISHFVFGDVIEPRLAKRIVNNAKNKGYTIERLLQECSDKVSVKVASQIELEWSK
ncbi:MULTISPECIES: AAA family ATPase [Pseudoalteromonas]|uniref:AAA family ATPase n=1 Tax=Pseudoalteromonas TaxID=53246 RepID=UPI00056B813D|nr:MULTISPECIES: AAA family ATPase [Pseudoalteromonas]MAY57583.1 ATP-binding protein [Pseudoalteromonas sp.]MDN3410724.1 AAA family ATPase [Pseudoalteromonas sp. APC 3894]MDN3418038.1 AAA family ATPase [Pseudoalteromonas sp. APC 3227]MDN3421746.1 AAA family ATPase [Pseudoalteromonas sp. APC 3895]MDN3425416.1 AAA family ATPase [Pseudoalteromonas sp. APC 3896]